MGQLDVHRTFSVCFLAAVTAAFSLPSPENLIVVLGAIGLGVGFGAGSGYAAWLQRTTPARIKATKDLDEARSKTTMAMLEDATARFQEATGRIQQLSQAVEKLESRVEEEEERNNKLRHDLLDEEKLNDKLRQDLLDFAMSVLVQKGHVQDGPKEG